MSVSYALGTHLLIPRERLCFLSPGIDLVSYRYHSFSRTERLAFSGIGLSVTVCEFVFMHAWLCKYLTGFTSGWSCYSIESFMVSGAICMELAKQQCDSQFLSLAIRSLKKAIGTSLIPLPIVSLLLAQVEGSFGSQAKWEKNLQLEWFSWPPGLSLIWSTLEAILLPVELAYLLEEQWSRLCDWSRSIAPWWKYLLESRKGSWPSCLTCLSPMVVGSGPFFA